MAQSSTTSDMASVDTQSQHTRAAFERGRGAVTNESKAAAMMAQANRDPALKVSMATRWNEELCCEARNSLQVILSGAEIMLDDHLGNLLVDQKDVLAKMTHNVYHLCNLLTALLAPEQFRLEETNVDRFRAVRRVPAKR
jgi:flagellar hook-length control protein FliK